MNLDNRPSLLRWIIGTILILISWLIIGALLTGIAANLFSIDIAALAGENPSLLASYQPWQAATTILISFLPLLLMPLILQRLLLRGGYRQLFTRSDQSFGREVRIGAMVMASILLITAIPDLALN